jgi:hypothetical protein
MGGFAETEGKSGRPAVVLNEEATHHVRPTDPTDPGDAADLSNSMGYLKVCLKARTTIAMHNSLEFDPTPMRWRNPAIGEQLVNNPRALLTNLWSFDQLFVFAGKARLAPWTAYPQGKRNEVQWTR